MGWLTWSYQVLFLQLLLLYSQGCAQAKLCSYDESRLLLQFKQLFSLEYRSSSSHCKGRFPSYPKTRSWKQDIDCCSWDGVKCDKKTGHVISLDLSCSWLHGSIPSNNTLFSLPHLRTLNLAFNDFNNSQISSDIIRFPSLKILNLSTSNFVGQIPYEISHLSKLVSLDLSHNFFTLEKPAWEGLVRNLTLLKELLLDSVNMSSIEPGSLTNLSSSLKSLNLNECGLKGSIPDDIFRLPNLHMLSLWDNPQLTGALPKVNWSTPLEFLYVSGINFSGELPNSIGNLKFLRQLSLHNCGFVGSVPESLGNLTQLRILDFSFNNLVGNVPLLLSNLDQLRELDLSDNNLSGEIPNIFANLPQLSFLVLADNELVGPIPCHVSGLQNLAFIFLYGNSLNGTIPSWIFTLPFLDTINLSFNQLSGQIPEFQSRSLRSIYLDNNRLEGSIPSSIFELVNLKEVELFENNLNGTVELCMFQKLKNLQLLDLSHNNLSLSTTCKVNSSFPKITKLLSLAACNLREFPDILRTLDQLQMLDLSDNKIHGQIPNWMWDIGKNSLKFLGLSNNFLTGTIQLPWKELGILDLRSNFFQGPLPIPPHSMRVILMSNNNLSGEMPLSICNISTIEILVLSNNSFSGSIPECMGNLNRLHVLDLQKNRFDGKIPGTFANCKRLRTLNFNSNGLEGPIPRSLVNCLMLEVLDFGNNKINESFPYWLGNLPKLQVLILRSNKFYGFIPDASYANNSFPRLRIFDISNNNFSGSLPTKYFENFNAMMQVGEAEKQLKYMGETLYQDSIMLNLKGLQIQLVKIITILTTIDFSNNNFCGGIPQILGNLQALQLLNLSQNNLTGYIPPSLENLTALESLDLSSNKFVGKIPWQLTRLNFLQFLNLSQNQLTGPIPQANHFDTFSNNSYIGNSGLCGFPLSKQCSGSEGVKQTPPIIFHEKHNVLSWFNWNVIMIGYGCGCGMGLTIGYIIFTTGKPGWFVRMVEKIQRNPQPRMNDRSRERIN